MNDLEFTFEENPWELFLSSCEKGGMVSAARFLTMMEEESEDAVEEALLELESRSLMLDISDLPKASGNGEAALRLRREAELVKKGTLLPALEENDPLRLYLEELSAIPACGDPAVLAMECAEGNVRAQEQLLNVSLNRVVEIAKELTGNGVLLLDLIQEGSLGLWQAIVSYEGGDFETISDRCIRAAMAKQITLQARASGVGQKMREALEDYKAVDERLLGELGRNATIEEIAEEIHMSIEETALVKNMLDSARLMNRAKAEQEPEEETPEDEQHVEDTALFQMRQRISDLLSGLSDVDAKLLTLRFGLEGGLPLGPEEVGRKLCLTPEEVVSREAAALAKLRSN
ncbi:MAG: sigma-70 family RNA polymerase sigma factor [Oscillospiraceae bacterium]|nr:sigma-70 family RNA polymerase sigma factor [Oscillospiraceae bacterium]